LSGAPDPVAVHKAAVRAEVERRGLASFMNATKWAELKRAVMIELPFVPAAQRQDVLKPPERLAGVHDCWQGHHWDHETIQPFYSIEWLRLIPRYYEFTGALTPYRVAGDCTDQLRAILERLNIPFREDRERTFWLYGYASADPATLTPPSETRT